MSLTQRRKAVLSNAEGTQRTRQGILTSNNLAFMTENELSFEIIGAPY